MNVYQRVRSLCRNDRVLVLSDNTRYTGDVVNGHMHGRGEIRYGNGDLYIGGVRNDMKHGRGILQYANGDIYEGEFLNDMRHGMG
jgi:hypothetical protein